MENDFKTKEVSFDFKGSSIIVDKSLRIIAINSAIKKIFPQIKPHQNFLDILNEEQKQVVENLFNKISKLGTTVYDTFNVYYDEISENIRIYFSQLKSENNVYYLITFESKKESEDFSDFKKLRLTTANLKELELSPQIKKLIDKVKLSFPFSFIEKAKFQKNINEIENLFWIKDINGNLLIVNEKFCEFLGLNISQVENKIQSDLLPKSISSLMESVDLYIKASNNPIIIENFSLVNSKSYSIVQIPLLDVDKNVVALIGFSLDKKITNEIIEKTSDDFLKFIPLSVCIVDYELKIKYYTNEFLKTFSLGEKVDLINDSIEKIFENEVVDKIKNFIELETQTEVHFSFNFSQKIKLKTEISLLKSEINQNKFIQIIVKDFEEKSIEKEKKALMYDALIELTPEPMFIYDIENLKFLEVNEQALKLYGYKRNEFLNMDLTDLYAPEDIQTLIETSDSKSLSKSFSGPWRHKKSNGESVFVELRRTQVEFNNRKAHLNLVRNISDQIETKKKQQLLETVYENTSDILIITDKDGFIKDINENGIKKLGYPKRELENSSFISLLNDDKRGEINKNVFHSSLPKSYSSEVEIKKPESGFQKANLIAAPIKNYNGEIESFCFIIKFIEEETPKDLKTAQIDETEKIDTAFLSNMFHEILTPLNVILGFTQELGESIDNPNDEQKEAIEIIKENQKILLQIMDNAVEYSQLEQKIVKFRTEEMKFVEILEEVKDSVKKSAEAKKIEIQYGKISSSLIIETDKQKFIYLLSLFLKFAIQITKEKSIYLSASIYNDNYAAIGIKDKTDGITPFLLKAFLEIFTEEETATRRNYGFSRFSIMLAKKLINLLSVKKSNITSGAEIKEFALIFPLKFEVAEKINAEVEVVKPVEISEIRKAKLTPTLENLEPEVQKKKIDFDISNLSCLYLEDQIDSQVLFKVQMKDLKNIEFASSFESAVPLLKAKKFDFILMDINLQGEYNGLDALRIIQKMPGYKNVPIIATTAYVQPGAKERFVSAGFADFVPKPLLREKIIESLKNLFQV
ncbi:PAS domain S-box protein [Stygiobacter electus]|uniref:histidine kinase n=1 Tax=Stygiobacter electus TaxID=3032292 RepID=A0AAE3P0B2_9BACT|nr:PAS domain S-box protein [Stygiobacter electus]MDF1610703.1 PAS domain S-box protein [Stygiobacter electus]